jgi:hypothetical protein
MISMTVMSGMKPVESGSAAKLLPLETPRVTHPAASSGDQNLNLRVISASLSQF